MIKLTAKQKFWKHHIECCDATGKDYKSYSKENDLNLKHLYHYRRFLINKGVLPNLKSSNHHFEEVSVSEAMGEVLPSKGINIYFPNGLRMEFPIEISNERIADLISGCFQ